MRYLPVTATGAALAWMDLGEGPGPVRVCLGGLGSAGTVCFADVAADPALAGTARQLLVDVIGSGWADHDDLFGHAIDQHAATVAVLLDFLALRDTEVVGHSLGGSVAISLAAQRPDLVQRLVVAEPNLDPGVGTVSAEVAGWSEEQFAATGHASMVASLRAAGIAGDANAAEFARTVSRWSPRGLHRTAVSLLASRPRTFREQLTAFARDKVYISGERSGEDLRELRATGCDVRVVPAAGHIMHADNPGGFAAAIAG